MSNVNVYLNKEQIVNACVHFKCLDSDLPKIGKAFFTNQTTSKWYRGQIPQEQKEVEIDKEKIIDEYLKSTEIGIISLRRSELTTEPKFTPKGSNQ